jgi:hypothetical protein
MRDVCGHASERCHRSDGELLEVVVSGGRKPAAANRVVIGLYNHSPKNEVAGFVTFSIFGHKAYDAGR